MKKLIILLCFLMLPGCNSEKEEVPKYLSGGLVSELHSIPQEDKIIDVLDGELECVEAFTTLAEEAEKSEYVVYGNVLEVSYIVKDGVITTVETLEIIECFKGDLLAEDVIYVQRDGGFCTVEEYIGSYELRGQRSDARKRVEELDEEDILEHADEYCFKELGDDSSYSEAGQELVYCLVPSGHYQLTDRYLPQQDIRFVKREDGLFEGNYIPHGKGYALEALLLEMNILE